MIIRTNLIRPRLEQPYCGCDLEETSFQPQTIVSMALLEHSLARLWAISPYNFLDYVCCHSENNVCEE